MLCYYNDVGGDDDDDDNNNSIKIMLSSYRENARLGYIATSNRRLLVQNGEDRNAASASRGRLARPRMAYNITTD